MVERLPQWADRAEFFTATDYAVRSFEAETPQQALELARQFYDGGSYK